MKEDLYKTWASSLLKYLLFLSIATYHFSIFRLFIPAFLLMPPTKTK